MLRDAATEPILHVTEVVEERPNKLVQILAGMSEGKRPPMEQGHAEGFLELDNLPTDGGLLYPVGHIAHPLADATIFGHVIEKLQVMDIHISNRSMIAVVLSIQQKELKSIFCRPI